MRHNPVRQELANLVLDNCGTRDLVNSLCHNFPSKKVAIGAHITTLNAICDKQIDKSDFSRVDFVYCDGWSIYILGKLSGLNKIQRIATTDLFPLVIEKLDRPLKVCFVGGRPEIGPLIIENWLKRYPSDRCFFYHGYQIDWKSTLTRIRLDAPDLIFLGLGMPLELQFINEHETELPNGIILTCGGMLRILAGVESRSPIVIQKLRLEWLFRFITSPRRTHARYSKGFGNLIRVAFQITLGKAGTET